MDRRGTGALAAALLASRWLVPTGRLAQDGGTQPPSNVSDSHPQRPRAESGDRCATVACKDSIHKETIQEGKLEYHRAVRRVIRETCYARDYGTKDKGAVENEEKKKDQAKHDPCHEPGNFIIALVPDPIHTHLALLFDRSVEVIQEAVQDEGYVFDRAVTPWDSRTHPESTDYESRLQAELYQVGREKLPGVIAFRGSLDEPNKRLFVLLVGESPTAGVRKQQFLGALDVIREFSPANKETKAGLRILGPTFSGSLDSLAKLLICENPAPKSTIDCPLVSIHSGSVSSREDILKFDEKEQQYNIHFVSLNESDDVMIERLAHFLIGTSYERKDYAPSHPYLSDRGNSAREIAVLSEDETAYGGVGSRPRDGKPKTANYPEEYPRAKANDLDYCKSDGARLAADAGVAKEPKEGRLAAESRLAAQARVDEDCFLRLYFPREISQLRAAYQDKLTSLPSNDGHAAPPRETLPSDFYVPGSNDDTVAGYSPKQMPLSQESVMLNIVAELRRHKIKFIILRATDPIDVLFLNRFLQSANPQGRIVTIDSDLLIRREADDPRLHGVLSLSTYFVVPAADHFYTNFEETHVERIFSSSAEVGIYNAMRSLLTAWVDKPVSYESDSCKKPINVDALTSDCRHTLKAKGKGPRLYQYGWLWEWDKNENHHTEYDAPPVRLAALGRDDFWPLASLGPFDGERRVSTLPRIEGQIAASLQKLPPDEVPTSWRVVQLAGILLGIAFAASVWRSSILARTQSDAKFAPAVLDGRASLVFIAGLTLILMLLILQWPTVKNADPGRVNFDPVLKLVSGVVFLCTCLDLINRSLLAQRAASRYYGLRWAWIGAFVSISGLLTWQVFGNQPEETQAFVIRFSTYRAIHLTSGLSFIMPAFFFLTVWLWWAYHSAAGYAVLDSRRPRLPREMKDLKVQGIGKEGNSAFHEAMHLNLKAAITYTALLLVFLGLFWRLGSRPRPLLTLERALPEVAMSAFFGLAVGGILIVTVQLWQTWIAVRKLLVALDSTPLRRGFEAVRGLSWKPIWRIGAGSLEEFQRMFAREKEALDCALNTYPFPQDNLDAEFNATLRCYKCVLDIEHPLTHPWAWWQRRKAECDLIQQFGSYQSAVSKVAGRALDFLAKGWEQEREKGDRDAGDRTPHGLGLVAWQRFVCLLYVNILLVVLIRIRCLIVAVGGMYVLTMIGVTQYPFEPKATIQFMLVVLLAFIVGMVGLVFAQMHRDATLSYITDTTPGELGADFWIRIASFTALPLFTLLASQFPSANRLFYSWVQPAIQALNR